MKASYLILPFILLVNCGSEESNPANQSAEYNQPAVLELSEEIPERFKQPEFEKVAFPKEVYDRIELFKTILDQFKELGFENRVNTELNEKYNLMIDELANRPELYDVSDEGASILHEYSHPLMEFFMNIENAQSEDLFKFYIAKANKYLDSFTQLFPQ